MGKTIEHYYTGHGHVCAKSIWDGTEQIGDDHILFLLHIVNY